jgi:GT2 family glycosyltransferase
MIDISIVIVNWNAKKFLEDCLISIYANKMDFKFEIFVVDNGSTDGSIELIRKKFPEVILIENKENLGFAKANNIGIKRAKGKYVCLINSDIVVKKGCFFELYNYMENSLKIGMTGPQLLNSDLTIQPSCKKLPTLWNNITRTFFLHRLFPNSPLFGAEEMTYFNHEVLVKVEALAGAFLMVRRNAIGQVGLLDEDFFIYSEDIDWSKRFWKNNWDIIFNPNAQAIHHDGGSSKRAPLRFYLEMIRAKLHYWRKHHNLVAIIIIHFILIFQHLIRVYLNSMIYIFYIHQHQENYQNIKQHMAAISLILRSLMHSKSISNIAQK